MSDTTTTTPTDPAPSKTIQMRMARATTADEDTVGTIHGILDDVFGGGPLGFASFPRGTDGKHDENDPNFFDSDKKSHLDILFNRLEIVIGENPGAMLRVAFGYNTLAHPRNALIDPDADHLAWHPRFARQDAAMAEAYNIIQTLHMEAMDHRESWPRALDWLAANADATPVRVVPEDEALLTPEAG